MYINKYQFCKKHGGKNFIHFIEHNINKIRYKVVFTFQVASLSSSPPPLNPKAYAGISQGLTAFCFLISELVPLAKQMFIIPLYKPGLGRGGFN